MPARHQLDLLLNPGSVALVGVSERQGSIGNWLLNTFSSGGFQGRCYLVNPNYDSLAGQACYPGLAALPEVPEMAVLNVGSGRMEALFDEACALGVRALTIFDYCTLQDDEEPDLLARLRAKAAQANVLVCGSSGMGFYNLDAGVLASYYRADHLVPGHISLIAHSGSVFTVLAMGDPRCRFNLVVSGGTEISVSADAYLDYALDMPTTRVVAMFLEVVRDLNGFARALERARERDIPVVVCNVGKTEQSAEFARTHTGGIAGNQMGYDALFERYGVLRADSLDELMATAALLAQGRHAEQGGLGAVLDSGGLRQLLTDRAAKLGVRLASISAGTVAEIEQHLPHTLTAANPLDAAGPFSYDFEAVFEHCLNAIMGDDDTAVGWFEFDATDHFNPVPGLIDVAKSVARSTRKPFLVVNSSSTTMNSELAVELADAGVPLINGVDGALVAVRNLLAYRDFRSRSVLVAAQSPEMMVDEALIDRWCERMGASAPLSEVEALELLQDFGIPTVRSLAADGIESVMQAAAKIGYPLVLKTAVSGIDHKTDADGVELNIPNDAALRNAYTDLSSRLGSRVTVASMVEKGIEIAFGMINDPQFGPLVVVSAGGTMIELLRDRVAMLAPVDEAEAQRNIDRLGVRPLLEGLRGAPAVNMDALVKALVRFSVMSASFADSLVEVDVNPLLCGAKGVVAVDALIVHDKSQ